MSKLENLTQKIIEDAEAKSRSILEDAEKAKKDIVDHKTKEAKDRKVRILEKAAFDAKLMKERILSNAEVHARNEELTAKQEVINRVFQEAKKRLVQLPEKEYTAFLQRTLDQVAGGDDAMIITTKDMLEPVKALGLSQKVSETEFVSSGFMVRNDKISMNFNFDDLVDYYKEEMVKDVADILFKG